MTDSEIEESLRNYLWLAANTPNSHANRIDQLLEECRRHAKPEIVNCARGGNCKARQSSRHRYPLSTDSAQPVYFL
jgi:hypothetical protein